MGIGLAVASIVGALASTAGAAYSVVQGERAERDAKRAGRARAEELRKAADVERERSRRLVASQRAAYGAAGVDPNFGSPLLVQSQTMLDSLRDQQAIIRGSEEALRNARSQASAYRAEGIAGGISGLAQAANFAIGGLNRRDFTPAGEAAYELPGTYVGRRS